MTTPQKTDSNSSENSTPPTDSNPSENSAPPIDSNPSENSAPPEDSTLFEDSDPPIDSILSENSDSPEDSAPPINITPPVVDNTIMPFVTECLENLKVSLPPEAIENLINYVYALLDYNQRVNLISRSHQEFKVVFREHIYDCLLAFPQFLKYYNFFAKRYPDEKVRILDMGSGAGLPGLPLTCLGDNLSVSLAETKSKKVLFLEEVCKTLVFPQAQVIHQNVHEIRERYDIITARAFGSVSKIYKVSKHVLNKSHKPSVWLLYKGKEDTVSREIDEFQNIAKKHRSIHMETHVLAKSTAGSGKASIIAEDMIFDKERNLVEIRVNADLPIENNDS